MYEQMDEHERDAARLVRTLYTDGGVEGASKSKVGGSWAYCGVSTIDARPQRKHDLAGGLDAQSPRVLARYGYIVRPAFIEYVTNNHTELIAALYALEAMPPAWTGRMCLDSYVTLCRLKYLQSWKNCTEKLVARVTSAVRRAGSIEYVLVQGHPTQADLACGIGVRRNLPVSVHNVYCDKMCDQQKIKMIEVESARRAERLVHV